ncbi:MAG: NAD(P)H-hydrate epimerase [Candidatus Woesearchaeota archaeon]|jgi:NAD(P)H-hydrate epimerase|nr:NAD(P)H-hydrate epimerase [Candidatus Woesearchaeota archaeon]MDP7457407.1 NAD(P)H-hydrate epimerase [Candidatus Woesearchaeota archaeon]
MIPTITKSQMAEVDRLMIEKYKIGIIQMMELAGFSIAELTKRLLKNIKGKNIVILAGKGNNGGDGICAARYLHNWGANPILFLTTEDLKKEPLHHLEIAKKTNIKIIKSLHLLETALKDADLIIDALLGYNIKGNPRGRIAKAIELANASQKEILSVDIPSGLCPDKGTCFTPCTNATYTLALSLPKKGSETGNFGENYVSDLGVLPEIYKEIGIKVGNIFEKDFILKM